MRALLIALTLPLVGCTPKGKAEVTEATFESDNQRRQLLEATLRVTDKHPEYVDELFQLTLAHPETLNRFLENTAKALSEPIFAQLVAKHLVAHPPGLRTTMVETLDAARGKPAAQRAIAASMQARAKIAAAILVDHPKELAVVSKAIVEQGLEDPDTSGKMKELLKSVVTD